VLVNRGFGRANSLCTSAYLCSVNGLDRRSLMDFEAYVGYEMIEERRTGE
jgi:hypothetical protein